MVLIIHHVNEPKPENVLATREEHINTRRSIEPTMTLIRDQLVEGLGELQRCIVENDHTSFSLHIELCQLDSLNTFLELCSPEYKARYITAQ
jgi:hypothetical protein